MPGVLARLHDQIAADGVQHLGPTRSWSGDRSRSNTPADPQERWDCTCTNSAGPVPAAPRCWLPISRSVPESPSLQNPPRQPDVRSHQAACRAGPPISPSPVGDRWRGSSQQQRGAYQQGTTESRDGSSSIRAPLCPEAPRRRNHHAPDRGRPAAERPLRRSFSRGTTPDYARHWMWTEVPEGRGAPAEIKRREGEAPGRRPCPLQPSPWRLDGDGRPRPTVPGLAAIAGAVARLVAPPCASWSAERRGAGTRRFMAPGRNAALSLGRFDLAAYAGAAHAGGATLPRLRHHDRSSVSPGRPAGRLAQSQVFSFNRLQSGNAAVLRPDGFSFRAQDWTRVCPSRPRT